jgi:hypothetical protein
MLRRTQSYGSLSHTARSSTALIKLLAELQGTVFLAEKVGGPGAVLQLQPLPPCIRVCLRMISQ